MVPRVAQLAGGLWSTEKSFSSYASISTLCSFIAAFAAYVKSPATGTLSHSLSLITIVMVQTLNTTPYMKNNGIK